MLAIFSLALSILSAVNTASANSAIASALIIDSCDFGEVYSFATVECDIPVSNTSNKVIHITANEAAKVGDEISPRSLSVPPNSTAYLHAKVSLDNAISNVRRNFSFTTDEAGSESRTTNAHGFVLSVLDDSRPTIDFGVVEAHAARESKRFKLESQDTPTVRAIKILEKPSYVDVEISPDGRSIEVKIAKNADWGIYANYIKLAIDSPRQKQQWVSVKADIHGDVLPSSNPFDLGLMRIGNANQFKLSLTSRTGKDFKVGTVKLDGIQGDVNLSPCAPAAAGCRYLNFKLPEKHAFGAVTGAITLELPDFDRHMRIAVWGLLLSKEMQVHSFDEASKDKAGGEGAQSSTSATSSGNLNQVLKNAVQESEEAPPAGKGPLLKWSVANETAIHGYQVFRSSDADGPFELLNRPTIACKNRDGGSAYQYRDNSAESNKVYWYYIGIVYNDGRKQQLTGPQKVVAK